MTISATFDVSKLSPYEDDEQMDVRMRPFQLEENDALEQPKLNVNLANKRPMESNFDLMVYKAQNLVFDQPTIYFNVSTHQVVN